MHQTAPEPEGQHSLPAEMSATFLDLFQGTNLEGGAEVFSHVVLVPHCLGKDRLGQLLEAQGMVCIQPPFMTMVRMDCSQNENYLKRMKFAFGSSSFLQPDTWDSKRPMRSASAVQIAEWQRSCSGQGGFCLDVAGSVICVSECPAYNECIRDERHLEFTAHASERVAMAMCRVLGKNTFSHLMQRLLALHEGSVREHVRRLQDSRDHCNQLQFHLLFMEDCFVMVKCVWQSEQAANSGEQLRSTGADVHVAFMRYTYFNALHAASVARLLEDFQSVEESQWEVKRKGQAFEPVDLEWVVEMIRDRCKGLLCADPEGVD